MLEYHSSFEKEDLGMFSKEFMKSEDLYLFTNAICRS
jgi:hypothetical protein